MHPRRAYRPNQADADRAGYLAPNRQPLDQRHDDWPGNAEHLDHQTRHQQTARTARPNHRGPRSKRWWPIVVPIAALGVGASLLSPAARHQWAISLFRQPTRYTTLSFNEAWELPAKAIKGKPVAVSFTVSNQEGRSVYYRYVLTQSDGRTSSILQSSARAVASGANWTVRTQVKPTCAKSPCQIKVALPGHPETIDFLLTVEAKRKKRH
jgi:hypothetical protein